MVEEELTDFEKGVLKDSKPLPKIKIPVAETIDLKQLKFDGDNPNKMTQAQKDALWENMKRFGIIVPIITNKDWLIADGQNRVEVLLEHGITKGPVIRLNITDVDRRILRQVLNKLHGQHDSVLDDSEYKHIYENEGADDLAKLLGESDQKLTNFIKLMKGEELPKEEVPVHVEPEVTCPKCGETFRPGKKKEEKQ